MKLFIKFMVTALFLFSFMNLYSGVKIITESNDQETNEKNIATLWIEGDLVVMETTGEDSQTIIYDLPKKEVTVLNHKDKNWMKMTKEQVDQSREYMKKQMQAIIDQQKATLAQLPPEQRAAVEAQMQVLLGEKDNIPVKYVKTGKKSKWTTKECSIYDGMIGKIKVEEICTIPQDKIPCSVTELEKLKQVSMDYGPKGEAEYAWKEMKTSGVPVIIKYFQAAKLVMTNTFTSFEKAAVPADKFKIPADYKQTASPFEAIKDKK